ncbi:hypothetical protein [Catenulispora pinisilvae]|uniref:hypothetical protein n=1 Tax=Catenulispora pinisilvae TaxID=2705253 RepID=UPI001891D36C|nr:hypothetical protein [Catenulispora pinisilvae]
MPEPALTLSAAVAARTATFTVELSGTPGVDTVELDFGDQTPPVTVTLDAAGHGTADHRYPAWSASYTARAAARVGGEFESWRELAGAVPTWADLPGRSPTWRQVSGLVRTDCPVTIELSGLGYIELLPQCTPAPGVRVEVVLGSLPKPVKQWNVWQEDRGRIYAGTDPRGGAVWDWEAPLGVELEYGVTVDYQDGSWDPLVPSRTSFTCASGCWLSSLATTETMPVTVQAWDSVEFEARQSVVSVAGRPDPVVVFDSHLWPTTSITLRTADRDHRDQLERILKTGSILLRTQGASSLDTVYLAVGNFARARMVPGDGGSWLFATEFQAQTIAAPPQNARPA